MTLFFNNSDICFYTFPFNKYIIGVSLQLACPSIYLTMNTMSFSWYKNIDLVNYSLYNPTCGIKQRLHAYTISHHSTN